MLTTSGSSIRVDTRLTKLCSESKKVDKSQIESSGIVTELVVKTAIKLVYFDKETLSLNKRNI